MAYLRCLMFASHIPTRTLTMMFSANSREDEGDGHALWRSHRTRRADQTARHMHSVARSYRRRSPWRLVSKLPTLQSLNPVCAQRVDTTLSGCSFAILPPLDQISLHWSVWRTSGAATRSLACPPCHPRRALPKASASKLWMTYLA